MARRKQQRASSGAPGIKNGMGGPSLNPIGLSRGGQNPLFIDITVARDYYEQNSEWRQWHADADAQARWAAPVQPRRRNNGGAPPVV
jgi:hypothetical protein